MLCLLLFLSTLYALLSAKHLVQYTLAVRAGKLS
jgi:hypothetical protein